ncbi:MAG: hypothetical protein GOV01_02210 [Candidatus Altiarchaeota archaeon]|nr:hypothetical protein [Candidatus Altiarchaeota archaeon]
MEDPKWVADIKSKPDLLSVNNLMLEAKSQKLGDGEHLVRGFRGPLKRNWWTLHYDGAKTMGITPPFQPLLILIEGDNLNYEGYIYDWVNVFAGTGGFKLEGLKLNEKFCYTEASQSHGTILQKATHQRNQAKEFLASIQNLKTAVINIESDMEKMSEQLNAFREGDWDQIKGLFIDNYGGPQRSWTAVARNVPLVRMAMTWFLRLKIKETGEEKMPIKAYSQLKINEFTKTEDLKEISLSLSERKKILKAGAIVNKKAMNKYIDELVDDKQINPAIGNYLKRKVDEFWNWVVDYVEWLARTRNNIQNNLIQQKANLKLYMRWAADHIIQAERLEMNHAELRKSMPEFDIKGSPAEMVSIDYLFYPKLDGRPDLVEVCQPWIPIIGTSVSVATTIDLQRKFMEIMFYNVYGYIKISDIEIIEELVKNNGGGLTQTMLKAGAVTKDELPRIFTQKEIEEMEGIMPKPHLSFKDHANLLWGGITSNVGGVGRLFGIDLPKENLPWTREMRATSIAADLALRGINTFKKDKGMLTLQ